MKYRTVITMCDYMEEYPDLLGMGHSGRSEEDESAHGAFVFLSVRLCYR